MTTEPVPASSISGTTARVRRMRAVTLIRKTRSQSVVVHLVDRREVVHDAGDVRQGVDPSARGSDDGGHGLFGGDVAGHGDQVQAGVLGHQGVQALLADVGGDDPAAFLGDAQGRGLADARSRRR